MPRRDGTGPSGQGPFTGRGLGSCNQTDAQFIPRFGKASNRFGSTQGFGQRFGFGCGRGLGRFFQNRSADERRELLMEEKNALTKRMEAVDNMLNNESKE